MKQIRKRLTYANVMSSIAVFLVLGGAAFAAVKLPKNSVGTKQLKKNAVTSVKIKNGAVTASKVNVTGLPKVPSAANADHATTADKAATATKADSATNAANAANATGLAGPLATGQTLRGTFEVAGTNEPAGFVAGFDISYAIPLASTPTTNVIGPAGPPTPQCPGSAENPTAASGQLCLYIKALSGATGLTELTGFKFPTRFGSAFFPAGVGAGASYQVNGTWAVTG